MKKWGSYTVQNPSEIYHHASLPIGGHRSSYYTAYHFNYQTNPCPAKANDTDTNTRAIFVLAAKLSPHCVYGNPFYNHAGFLNVFSVNPTDGLDKNIQNAPLDEKSAIHGMVFDSNEEYLYSADMWMDKIWCHRKVRPLNSNC